MRGLWFSKLALAAILLPSASYGSSYFLVATSQATGNTQLDETHTRIWEFNPAWDWEIGGGNFVIKRGNTTTLPAVLALHLGSATGDLLTSVSVDPSVATTTYAPVDFLFNTSYTMTAGLTYTLVLSSATGDNGSQQYFIKGGDNGFEGFEFQDETGNPLPESDPTPPTGGAEAVPEPASMLLTACGIGAIYFVKRR